MSLSGEDSVSEEEHGRIEKLEKLLRALQDIKSENARLRGNFYNLQEIHSELRSGYVELQEENNTLRSDFLSREVQLSSTVEELAQELDQSYKQFEEAKSHILTQTEAKHLEERLRNEIEGPFLAKIDELDNVIHEKIEDYSELWKVQEILKGDLESTRRRLQNELEVQESKHLALLEELEETKKITLLYSQDPNEVKKRSTELEVRIVEVEQQNKGLLDEIKAERNARLKAEVDAQKEVASFNSDRVSWKEKEADLRRKNDSMQRACTHYESEVEKSKKSEEDLNKALLQCQKELSDQKTALESYLVQRDAEKTLHESEVVKLKSDFSKERQQLENSIASSEKRISFLTSEHMKEVKNLHEEHKLYIGKLESTNSKLKQAMVENGAKDRATIVETQKKLSKVQIELDTNLEKVVKLDRTNTEVTEENSKLKEHIESKDGSNRKLHADLASCKDELLRTSHELEKQTDKCLRASADVDRLEREKRKLQQDYQQLEDRLRDSRRSYEEQIKSRDSELDESRRKFALERATTSKRQEEAQQSAVKSYLSANSQLKRKLTKCEEKSMRLEREYTLLLIKVAEIEAERKELRMQLNFGLSDLSAGTFGLSSNIRTLASDILTPSDDGGNDDEVALALAAVGA